jgi:hypothetical protein
MCSEPGGDPGFGRVIVQIAVLGCLTGGPVGPTVSAQRLIARQKCWWRLDSVAPEG